MRVIFCVSNKNLKLSGGMNKVLAYSLPEFYVNDVYSQIVTGKSFLELIKGLIRILFKNPFRFDVIVFNSLAAVRVDSNRYWFVYYFLSYVFRWKKVIYWHEMPKYFENYKNKHPLSSKMILNCFNKRNIKHLAVSEANSNIVNCFFDKCTKNVVYNTVDLSLLKGCNRFENPTVITIGTIQDIKGVDIWTDVAIGVCNINKTAQFIWCGTGNEKIQKKCQLKINDNNFEDRILFLNYINDPSILFHASHLYYLSSRLDSMPLVVLEAMSYGLNVVLYDSGGAIEAVGDLGYLIENFDVSKTITLIDDLLNKITSHEISVFNEEIKNRFEKNFSKEIFVSNFVSALKL